MGVDAAPPGRVPRAASPRALWRWIGASRALLVNTGSLLGSTAVTSGLGFVYWWLAAHRFPPAAVGFAAASVSAMTLLASVGVVGLGTLVIGELPRHPGKEGSLITTVLIVAGTAGGGLGVLFALLVPRVATTLLPLSSTIDAVMLFALGVSVTAVASVLDVALLGLLRGGLQLWRNGLFAGTKLGALAIVGLWGGDRLGLTIYATWVIGALVSLVGIAGVVARQARGKTTAYRPQWRLLRGLGRRAAAHHTLNLALQAPGMALPLVAATLLSTSITAYFYTAWMLVGFVVVVPLALATSLYAIGARAPAELAHKLRLTLLIALIAGILANGALLIGAHQILGVFGHAYAEQAGESLRILGLGVFPLIIKDHYVAIVRVYNRVARAAALVALGSLLELVLAALGAAHGGLAGLSLGWLAAVCIEAVCMIRTVYATIALTGTTGLRQSSISTDGADK